MMKEKRTQHHLQNYSVDFHDNGRKTLVVTFEPAGNPVYRPNMDRMGWGVDWLCREGHSVLAVKPLITDWYRKKDLHEFMRSLEAGGFFENFEHVVFYGVSMAGYAALAFSRISSNCTVIALSPQVTLAPAETTWDPRFKEAKKEDWTGDFPHGFDCSHAKRVFVIYDPMNAPDKRHAESIEGKGVVCLKFPAGGHLVATQLARLKLLGPVIRAAVDGSLSLQSFAKLARRRRDLIMYWSILAKHARSYALAKACVDRARAIRSDDYNVAFYDAYVSHKWKDWSRAQLSARIALKRRPNDFYLYLVLAEALRGQNRPIAAKAACLTGLRVKPGYPRLENLLRSL